MTAVLNLARRLAEERQRLGMSRGQIAAKCGTSRGRWDRYETGVSSMPLDVLLAFADLVGASVDELLGREVKS